jgi:gliding motility-associated-like protein
MIKPVDTGDSWNMNLVGRWANGPCETVAAQGNIAFFGNGAYLNIVDFSDPEIPVELSKLLLPELPLKIVVSGDYCYVIGVVEGVWIYDISDLGFPQEVGFFSTTGDAEGIDLKGSYAYVADAWEGLRIIDVSSPDNPNEVGFIETTNSATAIAVDDSFAYVADSYVGLRVIDIKNPTEPQEVGFCSTPRNVTGILINDNYAYVADQDSALFVVDISDPSDPQIVGSSLTPSLAYGVAVNNGYAFVADGWNGLYVIDVSIPTDPKDIGFWDTEGRAIDLTISNNSVYIADDFAGLCVIDISNPLNPIEIGSFNTAGSAEAVAVKDDYAYIADSDIGLHIIDLSSMTQPQEIGFYYTGDDAEGVVVDGSYAYVLDHYTGLHVIDISNPSLLNEVGVCNTPNSAVGMAFKDGYAHVADYSDGIRLIDLSNPTNPIEVGFFTMEGRIRGVAVGDNYVYIACSDSGLRIIDFRNIPNPQEVGSYIIDGGGRAIAVKGNYVYIPKGSMDELSIIDVSIPSNPIEVGSYSKPGYMRYVTLKDNYAYVSNGRDGIFILDVSNPSNPIEVGFYDTASYAREIYVDESYIYVTDRADGLYILEYIGPISGKPGTPLLSQPMDNFFTNNKIPELTWNVPADNDGDLLHFKIEIATDNDFLSHISHSPFESQDDTTGFNPEPPVAEGSGLCSFIPIDSLTEDEYWWRVTAWDGQEYSTTSSSRKFTIDTASPYTTDHYPAPDDISVSLTTNIVVHVQDSTSGVNQSSIVMKINDEVVMPGITGTLSDYTLTYDPAIDFDYSQEITVSIDAEDIAGNSMATEIYSFLTESMGEVTTPVVPTGLSSGKVGESITFSSGGSTSDLGNDLEYRFDFGDGSISVWGDTIQSHIYLMVGTFAVKARARSQLDTTIMSNWSSGKNIMLSGHLLEIMVNGSGSVTMEPDKNEYNHNEKVVVTASPSSNFQFDHWEGSLSGTSNPDSITMNRDINITAHFRELTETVSVLPNPFTPNDDGFNDYVAFKYPEMDTKKPVVRIFNLRGRKVNQLNHFSGNEYRWNGKDEDGKTLDPGVYLYILEVDNKMISSGSITLVR